MTAPQIADSIRIRLVTATHVAQLDVPRKGPTVRITLGQPAGALEIPFDMLDGATVFTDAAAIEKRRRGCVRPVMNPEQSREEKRR